MSKQKDKGTLQLFATPAALTERGGPFSTASGFKLFGLSVARGGDVVTYPDGSEAIIGDGAGYGCVIENRAAALVGSHLSNGEKTIEAPWGNLAERPFFNDAPMQRLVHDDGLGRIARQVTYGTQDIAASLGHRN